MSIYSVMFGKMVGRWFDSKAVETFTFLFNYFVLYASIYIILMWLSEHYKHKEVQ